MARESVVVEIQFVVVVLQPAITLTKKPFEADQVLEWRN